MKIFSTGIESVSVVESEAFVDHRGAFTRLFCDRELSSVIGSRKIVQSNHSRTETTGAIRGMHYQLPPHSEMKLVRCIKGRVWDVAVDLRAGSPSFLKWHAEELSPENARMLVIPEGCAHGFQVLEQGSEIIYFVTAHYTPAFEAGLRYNDPALRITWPMRATDLSDKDKNQPLIDGTFKGIGI